MTAADDHDELIDQDRQRQNVDDRPDRKLRNNRKQKWLHDLRVASLSRIEACRHTATYK